LLPAGRLEAWRRCPVDDDQIDPCMTQRGAALLLTWAEYRNGRVQSENLFNWHLVPAPYGEALIAVGDLDRAAAVLDRAIAACREAEANHFLAVMMRVKGQTARGDRVGAERAFQESVQLHESLGTRLELTRSAASQRRAEVQHLEGVGAAAPRPYPHRGKA
jgi:hypothetical protein